MPAEYIWNVRTRFPSLGFPVSVNTKFTVRKMWEPLYICRKMCHYLLVPSCYYARPVQSCWMCLARDMQASACYVYSYTSHRNLIALMYYVLFISLWCTLLFALNRLLSAITGLTPWPAVIGAHSVLILYGLSHMHDWLGGRRAVQVHYSTLW